MLLDDYVVVQGLLFYRIAIMFQLREETKQHIAKVVGRPFDQVCQMDLEDVIAVATAKHGVPPKFAKTIDVRKLGRGNPYLATGRITTKETLYKELNNIR